MNIKTFYSEIIGNMLGSGIQVILYFNGSINNVYFYFVYYLM